jgi:hypothetical protein
MVLIYLPSLIVTEKYASNRTLLALNLAIFFLVAESLFAIARTKMLQSLVAAAVSMFFLINAWYNFHHQFIYPLRQEYNAIKGFMDQYYQPAIKKLYVIKPREDAFHIKYGIVQSWDEFGIPSTAMPWAPEPLIRQLVFEKTGNRAIAENLSIEFFTNSQRFQPVQRGVGPGHLLLDMPALINNENRASR